MEWIVMDIEGTTTSIDFVHKVLFPYSRSQLKPFLNLHAQDPEIRIHLEKIWTIDLNRPHAEPLDLGLIHQTLQSWIEEDRKHPILKALQGKIWSEGYTNKSYQSHVYPDVPPSIESWYRQGIRLAIYSSGSVEAQKLLFGHTEFGDLNPLISCFFDISMGHKRESIAYKRIVSQLAAPAAQVLFLSDIAEELDAAAAAGMQTCQVLRPGTKACPQHRGAVDFLEVSRSFEL